MRGIQKEERKKRKEREENASKNTGKSWMQIVLFFRPILE